MQRVGWIRAAMGAVLCGGLAVSAVAQGSPTDGTELQMRAVTVKDQNQLRGYFGDKWEPGEVRDKAAQVCAEAGMRLVYFQPGNTDSSRRTQFAAVCQ
ncbi:hypothetical protein [Maliponia aquimaris]|uniref:Uncharacterized protein n=1 Tax=Maliponia aquimaris TaxID=1673631 RepID=A0A238K6Y9_9RHOB|nr:hypothetical protein [Maliponia aquimaris]SMX37872.1 hypothetical protein MAA8898_01290 [Maliponia aquimaris]